MEYNVKCLFVTGGCGFIGSNFINIFNVKYPDVKIINFDALYYCAHEHNVHKNIRESNNYKFIKGNLQSFEQLQQVFTSEQITHIIHFAAQSHVEDSFNQSSKYVADNILGTHNLLEVSRLHCPTLCKFINVSTDEVYGESLLDLAESAKTENSKLCPTNPYAATKAGAELLATSYMYSFDMPIIITRGNNVYGINQYPEKLIPKFIEQLRRNEKVTIQGDGCNVRAFLHVDDTVNAFETILFNGKIGDIYNIGCDEGMEYTVIDIAKKLIKLVKNDDDYEKWIMYVSDRQYNDARYKIDNSKIAQLGWSPKIKLDDGLVYVYNQMIS